MLKYFRINQKGIAHVFLILLLVIGIGVGLYMVQRPQIFAPKAAEQDPTPVFGVHKYYNAQLNHWTWAHESSEHNFLLANGYSDQGVLFYAYANASIPNTFPIYRLVRNMGVPGFGVFMTVVDQEKQIMEGTSPIDSLSYNPRYALNNASLYVHSPYLPAENRMPIYRLKYLQYTGSNPLDNIANYYGSYYYSNDRNEVDALMATGAYQNDGVIFYSVKRVEGASGSARHIIASPSTCVIRTGNTCESKIEWDYTGYAHELDIKIKVNGNLFAAGPKGVATAPWISAQGVTFEVYNGNALIDSLFVNGSKEGLRISANPNPCTLGANGLCTAKIKWEYPPMDIKIRIKENPGSLFAHAHKGEQDAPWISAQGATFQVWHDNNLVEELFVKGQ